MTLSFSDTEEIAILDALLEMNNWVGLSTADPGEDGATLAEPSGNGYARVAVTTATWDPAAAGAKANGAAITFPEASGSWGTVTYVCIFPSAISVIPRVSIAITGGGTAITSGKTARFAAGALIVTLG
jgi:hypothetical protein